MIYCFDIDGTLCSITDGQYIDAEPFSERIRVVNDLYDKGNQIFLYTARGSQTGIDWENLTRNQLAEWGVKYHRLSLGKPHYDVWIDDKAISDQNFFKVKR